MIKQTIITTLALVLLVSLVSAVDITETTFLANATTNYSIHVNGTITVNSVTVSDSITFDGLNTTGTFTNTNGTYTSIINFTNLVDPYNRLAFSNGTLVSVNEADTAITVPPGVVFTIADRRGYDRSDLADVCENLSDGFGEFGQLLVLVVLAIVMTIAIGLLMNGQVDLKTVLVGGVFTLVFVVVINILGVIVIGAIC